MYQHKWNLYPLQELQFKQVLELMIKIIEKIDEKNISDYEFREWLRDNLSSCEYRTETGDRKYTRPTDVYPISVLDAMIQRDEINDNNWR